MGQGFWDRLRRGLLAAALLLGLAGSSGAVQIAYQEPWGPWRVADDRELAAQRAARPLRARQLVTPGVTWNVTYADDGTGLGFDDPAKGAARKAVVTRMLDYLGTLLDYEGVTLDVHFNTSRSQNDGTLASAGTYHFTNPGYSNGLCFQHAHTGTDPSGSVVDIYCTVNFYYDYYTGTGQPGFSQSDFASVLLHEFTHGLGIASLLDANGTSKLNHLNPGPFTVWDDFLYTSQGVDLCTAGGAFTANVSDLIGGNGWLVFRGPNAQAAFGAYPPIYAPNPYEPGSSISHWTLGITGGAVMEPAIYDGTARRTFSPVDLAALKDLGWKIKAPAPPPTNAARPAAWVHYE